VYQQIEQSSEAPVFEGTCQQPEREEGTHAGGDGCRQSIVVSKGWPVDEQDDHDCGEDERRGGVPRDADGREESVLGSVAGEVNRAEEVIHPVRELREPSEQTTTA
jgi:hypothetical protein